MAPSSPLLKALLDGYIRKVTLERRTAVFEKTKVELESRRHFEEAVSETMAKVLASLSHPLPSYWPLLAWPSLHSRASFSQIKRPYFHVKPLERAQLKNWKEYLDFEISQRNSERIAILFERCMIACALYEDFWTKVGGA